MQTDRRLETKQLLRAWVLQVVATTHKKLTPLATHCNIHPSTLLRAVDMDDPALLSTDSIDKIVRATGMAPPKLEGQNPNGFGGGLAEPGVVPYTTVLSEDQGPLTANQFRWEVKDRSLELAGYLPGDIVWTDKEIEPKHHDVVIAQVVDLGHGFASTVLRRYQPPFLTVATQDPSIDTTPFVVNPRSVSIDSVVYKSLRRRS